MSPAPAACAQLLYVFPLAAKISPMPSRLRAIVIFVGVAAGLAAVAWSIRQPARAMCVLSGPSVLGFVETAAGIGCMTVGGTVWALSATATEPRALFRIDRPLASPPLSNAYALMAVTAEGAICAWDAKNGSELWHQSLSAPPTAPMGVHLGTVAVPLWPSALALLDERTGALKGKLVLTAAVRLAPIWWQGQWVVVTRSEELLFISDDGKVRGRQGLTGPAIAAAAEGEHLWIALAPNRITLYTTTGPGPSTTLPSGISLLQAGDDKVVAAGDDGELTCLATGGMGVRVAWRCSLPDAVTSLAGPYVANGKALWVAGTVAGHIALLDADTGTLLRVFRIARAPVIFLALSAPFVAAATADGVWLCPLPQ